jgi:hypothetical protein
MASKESARKVARAQASGRGRRVRRELPLGYYSVLALVVVLGVATVGYSKYELDHPSLASSQANQPTVGTVWHVAIGFDACGHYEPVLAKTSLAKTGVISLGNGVLTVAPKTKAETGAGANLSLLPKAVSGLELLHNGFRLPGKAAVLASAGCHGKPASFGIYVWPSLLASKPTLAKVPSSVRFANDEVIAVAVLPKGTTPSQPPTAANLASVGTASSGATSTSKGTTSGGSTPNGSSSSSKG